MVDVRYHQCSCICMQAFKNYITTILTRVNTLNGKQYRDDPAVFSWVLANEATSTLDQTGETVNPSCLCV